LYNLCKTNLVSVEL